MTINNEQIQALKAAAIAVGRDGRTDDEWFHYLLCVHYKFILSLLADREADKALIAELQGIRAAAEKLVRCKGRYHSEQNYRALAALFGVKTPDLPPLGGEAGTLTVKLPEPLMPAQHNSGELFMTPDNVEQGGYLNRDDVLKALRKAGITLKVGGE